MQRRPTEPTPSQLRAGGGELHVLSPVAGWLAVVLAQSMLTVTPLGGLAKSVN